MRGTRINTERSILRMKLNERILMYNDQRAKYHLAPEMIALMML